MKTLAKEYGFGTWNVRTMLRPGLIKELIPQIRQYNIHVMAIQETRCPGEAIIDLKNHMLLQTGKNTGGREFGVPFIDDNRCRENILDFQPINERKRALRMKQNYKYNIYKHKHTLMEDKDKKEKEDFYAQLDAMIWLHMIMPKSSWGTQMPKLDKKENITQ